LSFELNWNLFVIWCSEFGAYLIWSVMRQLNTDCEGPICLNDNALELAQHFIPDGAVFYTQVSRYDDYLVEIARKPGYQPGYTLKLIVPFLLAYGATSEKIEQYSTNHICYVPGAQDTFSYLKKKSVPIFIVSTSYQQFALPLGKVLGVPLENIYCTKLEVEGVRASEEEMARLRAFKSEIATLPELDLENLGTETEEAVKRLDEIFWQEIPSMEIGQIYSKIHPIGGEEKAKAVLASLEKTGNRLCDVVYIGDSITDVSALKLVKENGGLAVAFNGNRYAIEAAEIACISKNTVVTTILVDIFVRKGKEKLLEVVGDWGPASLKSADVEEGLIENLASVDPIPVVEKVEEDKDDLIARSEVFREEFRGELVGRLG